MFVSTEPPGDSPAVAVYIQGRRHAEVNRSTLQYELPVSCRTDAERLALQSDPALAEAVTFRYRHHPAGSDREATGPVVIEVHADLGPLGNMHVLVDDGVADVAVPADGHVVEQHAALHGAVRVQPHPAGQHRITHAGARDDHAAGQERVECLTAPFLQVMDELRRRTVLGGSAQWPLLVVQV